MSGTICLSSTIRYDDMSVDRSSPAASQEANHSSPALAMVRLLLSAVWISCFDVLGDQRVTRVGIALALKGLQMPAPALVDVIDA